MGLGEMGNFLAYGFAPASMIAPLGSVAVISNTILASVYLGEPLTMASMMGVTLVVVRNFLFSKFFLFVIVFNNSLLTIMRWQMQTKLYSSHSSLNGKFTEDSDKPILPMLALLSRIAEVEYLCLTLCLFYLISC